MDSDRRASRRGQPQTRPQTVGLRVLQIGPDGVGECPSSGGSTTLLLEREVQVAVLEALADAAQSGGRFVVIEGSAGVGKTRLAEARVIAGSAAMRVIAARGGELTARQAARRPSFTLRKHSSTGRC
jgi:hypothetical protein